MTFRKSGSALSFPQRGRLGAVGLAMLFSIISIISIVGAPTANATGSHSVPRKMQHEAFTGASRLFVASAGSGSLVPRPNSSTQYSLTLEGFDRNIVWFTDRPARIAGTESTSGVLQNWAGYGFAADPPNAALVLDSTRLGHDTAVGTLSSLTFDPGTDRLQALFTIYKGERLKSVGGNLADKARRDKGAALPTAFGGSSLFIDDAASLAEAAAAYIDANAGHVAAYEQLINADHFPQQLTVQPIEELQGSGVPISFGQAGSPTNLVFGLVTGSFAHSTFAGPLELVAQSMAGVDLSDATQVGSGSILFLVSDLSDANLQGVDLPNASFVSQSGVDLDGADLQGATLGQVSNAITNADTTCTNGLPGPCNGPNLSSS
jgi:hypothetical protein